MRYRPENIFFYCILIGTFLTDASFAQVRGDSVVIQTGTILSGGRNAPFWLLSNRHGNITNGPFNAWLRTSAYRSYRENRTLEYSWGFDVYGLFNDHRGIVLNQAYLRLRYAFVEFEAGKRERKYGNQESALSSGGLLWSGNAPVLPVISLRTKGYIDVPFTSGFLRMKAGISNGWYGEDKYTRHEMLHQKYLYLSTTDRLPVKLSIGLLHFVQWGGVSTDSTVGALPSGLNAFLHVFTGRSGTEDSPENEKLNALGNHLGSYNVRLDVRLGNADAGIYWQSIFEDNSGRKLQNGYDGLWGVSLHLPEKGSLPNTFLIEYLNTTDQSGQVQFDPDRSSPPEGNDNYFNNYLYRSGWSYMQRSIGTPLISSPLYFDSGSKNVFCNNRVKAYHLGFSGEMHRKLKLDYYLLYTLSKNLGTYYQPFTNPKFGQSILLSFRYVHILHSKYDVYLSVAMDYGEIYGQNGGLEFKISRQLY